MLESFLLAGLEGLLQPANVEAELGSLSGVGLATLAFLETLNIGLEVLDLKILCGSGALKGSLWQYKKKEEGENKRW